MPKVEGLVPGRVGLGALLSSLHRDRREIGVEVHLVYEVLKRPMAPAAGNGDGSSLVMPPFDGLDHSGEYRHRRLALVFLEDAMIDAGTCLCLLL
jgi:hypothetical protein